MYFSNSLALLLVFERSTEALQIRRKRRSIYPPFDCGCSIDGLEQVMGFNRSLAYPDDM